MTAVLDRLPVRIEKVIEHRDRFMSMDLPPMTRQQERLIRENFSRH